MRVYLVRHGQTAWNAEQRAQGHTDIQLDEQGREQASLLAAAFDERPIKRLLASDLMRARDTAAPLSQRSGVPIEPRFDLRERSFGDWEGLPFEIIAKSFIEEGLRTGKPPEEVRPPNGESQLDVWERLERIADEIGDMHEPVAIVSHGGACGLLLARLLRGTLFTARSFRFDNAGITTLNRRPDGGFHLVRYNDSSHVRLAALSGSVDGTTR